MDDERTLTFVAKLYKTGLITIPKSIRDALIIDKGNQIKVSVQVWKYSNKPTEDVK